MQLKNVIAYRMARITDSHGCYYKAINILFPWGNTVYLANDLRTIIKDISYWYDDEEEMEIEYEGKYEYVKADCCPLTCNIVKPKFHDDLNYKIYDKQKNYTD